MRTWSASRSSKLDEREVIAMPVTDELWTVDQVARYLRFHVKTVYQKASAGQLPCFRVCGRLRFSRNDIDRWLAARKEG